ncbi:MAG: DUF4263 domain-containing protein [Desulfobacterales bacterium]|uniref:DUF4263 domain-containing protein n=1 Tax=Candidatus Desulfatibia profunda TaxID=2841695 RepID=A0A8J6TKM1_9BACT|nr:DUF4263 domain-containing protein [Candidatus Desulfatibia profunda]MBL7178727.1 DUF4263 domain-containing protein [Desulfobacterales bacterium]
MESIRDKIQKVISAHGVKLTPQALNSLVESIKRSASSTAGDSDSLLAGLLYSGSYTIDILKDSGVNPYHLRLIAEQSAKSSHDDNNVDSIDSLFSPNCVFGKLLNEISNKKKAIETSDLLAAGIKPQLDDLWISDFPIELRSDIQHDNIILKDLDLLLCRLIAECADALEQGPSKDLRERQKSLNEKEKNIIRKHFEFYGVSKEGLQLIIDATNRWFSERSLQISNSNLMLSTSDVIFQREFGFGTDLFLESGGSIDSVAIGLNVARRLSPERDSPKIALFERDGRIFIKPYTYSNIINIETPHNRCEHSYLSLNAPQPLSLLSKNILDEFEEMLSKNNTSELEIQKFLEHYPEIVNSLGYASAIPHVILTDQGKQSLVPDFILFKPGNRGFDILDLKKPTTKIAVRSPYLRISHEISKAIAQLRAYKNYFKKSTNRDKFVFKYGIEVFEPEIVVIIGMSTEFRSPLERVEIEKQASGIRLYTYDELVDYGRSRSLYVPNLYR